MTLSKARNAARMRNKRALEKGVQPSATQLMEVMSTNQRKERLAELIVTPMSPDKVNPTHIIAAIDIYNKMDKIYSEVMPLLSDNRTLNIYVTDSEAKELLARVSERTKNAIQTEGTGQDMAQAGNETQESHAEAK